MTERRADDRVEVRATVTVFDGEHSYGMTVVDISRTGAYLTTEDERFFRDAGLGRLIEVVLVCDAPYAQRTRLWGSIVRMRHFGGPQGPGFAIRFMPMPPDVQTDVNRMAEARRGQIHARA